MMCVSFSSLSRWAPILLPPLQPSLRWPLQPAGSSADPRRGKEVPVWHLLSHLQPHVIAAETQLLRVLLHRSMKHHRDRQRGPTQSSEQWRAKGLHKPSWPVNYLQGFKEHDMTCFKRLGGNQASLLDLMSLLLSMLYEKKTKQKKPEEHVFFFFFFSLPILFEVLRLDQIWAQQCRHSLDINPFVAIVPIPMTKYVVNSLG